MAGKATIVLVMIALSVAVALPVLDNASGLTPSDERLPSEAIQAVDARPPDEDEGVEDELGDGEAMDGEETVVFRPLFVHRQRQARRQQRRLEQQQRWSSYFARHPPRVYY